jgi:hypothetical protein
MDQSDSTVGEADISRRSAYAPLGDVGFDANVSYGRITEVKQYSRQTQALTGVSYWHVGPPGLIRASFDRRTVSQMADIPGFRCGGFAGQPLPRLRQQCAL